MPVPDPIIDDEVLMRVLTGAASGREQETVVAWRRASAANEYRFRGVERILDALAAHERTLLVSSPPAAVALLRRATLRQARRGSSMRRLFFGGIAASIALTAFALAEHPSRSARGRPFAGDHISTGPRQLLTTVLADSTRVQLGPASHVRTSLNGETREVWLEGHAEFSVARQQGRRFVVRTHAGDAADIGTRFIVRADSAHTQVVVFEGRVALSTRHGTAEAGPGEMITTSLRETPPITQLAGRHSISDWLRAALVFESAPLDEVGRMLTARYGLRVSVPRELANRTVTGWFVDEPTATQALTAICRAVGARCSIGDTTAVFSR
jgi:ferric-dicitrate binding protein FerR (iron transport regulator)